MKARAFLAVCITSIFLLGITSSAPARAGLASSGRAPRGGEILVKFRAGATPREIASAHARAAAGVGFRSRRTGWEAVALPPGADLEKTLRGYQMDAAVESAEIAAPRRITKIPNDLLKGQWGFHNTGQAIAECCVGHLELQCRPCSPTNKDGTVLGMGTPDADIDAPEAWNLATGSEQVVVAVLDTGVDPDRDDLGQRLLPGYDFVNDDADPDDDHGHGTAVSSIIGAVGNNGSGMTGLNWAVSILPLKVCRPDGQCPESLILAAIDYAIDHGADVISMSLACDEHEDPNTGDCGASFPGQCYTQAEQETIERALAEGVSVVEAAANCGHPVDDATTAYPCAHGARGNICAAATTISDAKAGFSNYGRSVVDIAAPGALVLVYKPTEFGGWSYWSGTSFATPMTSGVAALLLSRAPLTPEAVRDRIVMGGDPILTWVAEGGRLNALNTVRDIFRAGRPYSQEPPGDVNLLADVNGDGRGDLVRGSAGSGFQVAINSAERKIFKPSIAWAPADPAEVVLAGDADGNGREDLILIGAAGHQVLRSGRGAAKPLETWNGEAGSGSYAAGDFNGDRRTDLIRYGGSFEVMLSTGAAFGSPQAWSDSSAGAFFAAADVNGDRIDDLINVVQAGAFDRIEVSMSRSTSFGPPGAWLGVPPGLVYVGTGDFDGDGFEDLLVADPAAPCLNVSRSNGHGFDLPRPWACPGVAPILMPGRLSARRDLRADLLVHTAARGWELLQSSP